MARAEVGDGRLESGAFGVGEGVVGHDPLDAYAQRGEPGGGAIEEAGAAGAARVGQQLGVGKPRGIVDRDMEVLPADPARPVAPIAGDPVAETVDPAELLAVEVEEFAGGGALIANHWRRRLQGAEPAEAEAAQHAADGRAWPAEGAGDPRPAPALAAQALDGGDDAGRQLAGRAGGRRAAVMQGGLAAVAIAREPSVGGALRDPAAAAASATRQPASRTRWTMRSRPWTVMRAFLWTFIRGSRASCSGLTTPASTPSLG
jgi:hypothetical protein